MVRPAGKTRAEKEGEKAGGSELASKNSEKCVSAKTVELKLNANVRQTQHNARLGRWKGWSEWEKKKGSPRRLRLCWITG